MYTGASPREESDAAASRSAYAWPAGGRARSSEASVAVAGTAEAVWLEAVERVRVDRDQQAFVTLFRHFAPRVKAFLMKSGASESLAEECTQEVMATLWHKAHLFDPARASVATWIFTIARNRKIDALRKQRRPEPEDLGPEYPAVARPERVSDWERLLYEALYGPDLDAVGR